MQAIRPFALLLLALSSTAAAAASGAAPADVWLSAKIGIDAEGRVTDLAWNKRTPLHGLIAEKIDAKVRAWQFIPATVSGRPAATQTGLVIHLRPEERPDGAMVVQMLDAKTGPMALQAAPPQYPTQAAYANVSAKVVFDVSVDADGTAVVHDVRFSGSRRQSYRNEFVGASQAALKAWSFYPEVVDGQAVPTLLTMPVMFCMEPSAWCKQQRQEAKAKLELPPYVYMASESAVALKTEIQGLL